MSQGPHVSFAYLSNPFYRAWPCPDIPGKWGHEKEPRHENCERHALWVFFLATPPLELRREQQVTPPGQPSKHYTPEVLRPFHRLSHRQRLLPESGDPRMQCMCTPHVPDRVLRQRRPRSSSVAAGIAGRARWALTAIMASGCPSRDEAGSPSYNSSEPAPTSECSHLKPGSLPAPVPSPDHHAAAGLARV